MPRCPQCREMVSAKASRCPSCGAPRKSKTGSGKGEAVDAQAGLPRWVAIGAAVMGAVAICVLAIVFIIRPAIQDAFLDGARQDLLMMRVALENYHDTYRQFPPASDEQEDRPARHGWMARLLPVLDLKSAGTRITFEVPWTDDANRSAYAVVVPEYQHPGVSQQADSRGYALAHYAGNAHVFGARPRPLGFADLRDGTSQTLLVAPVADGFLPWGSTDNMRDTAEGIGTSARQFGSPVGRGLPVLMADGAVHLLKLDIDPAVFTGFGTPTGGEALYQFDSPSD